MSETTYMIMVKVHEGNEVPAKGILLAYMKTQEGWEVAMWLASHWETYIARWVIKKPGPWVELKDLAEAIDRE